MDPRAWQIINEAHKLLQFNQLLVLCDIRARSLFNVHGYAWASTEGAHLMFIDMLNKIHVKSNREKEMVFDEQFANVEDLTAVN